MSTTSASRPITMTDQARMAGESGSYYQQQPQQPPLGILPTPSFPEPPLPDPRPGGGGGGGGVGNNHQQQPKFPDHLRQPLAVPHAEYSLKATRAASEASLREYLALQRRRRRDDDPAAEHRLWIQRDAALAGLKMLRSEVGSLVQAGESHRWGRWVLGAFFASLIPVVRRIFRRPAEDVESSNDTEYAFRKSKSLISRTWALIRNNGALASMAMVVLSVLYVFQAEVTLRVSRTISKRLKRLIQRIEIGNEILDESDLELFGGWRWRVLAWKS